MDNPRELNILDCSLRDGGYYTNWDFNSDIIDKYLDSISVAGIDIVELGYRFVENNGFKGALAYTSEEFLDSLQIPCSLTIGVMVNGADLCAATELESTISYLFPVKAKESKIDLIRIACHYHEILDVLPAVDLFHNKGYRVGLNLMQIVDKSMDEISLFAQKASYYPIEVLYFADSIGNMSPESVVDIYSCIRESWDGDIGIHAHDSTGLALSNTIKALELGATWLDATITGIGRGPGNTRIEELLVELDVIYKISSNIIPLLELIREYFLPLKNKFCWGTNAYYFMAAKFGIHPSYVQYMLSDSSFREIDIIHVINNLRGSKGKNYNIGTLQTSKYFYSGEFREGKWHPESWLANQEIFILGPGVGVKSHQNAIEQFIRNKNPFVMALNTHTPIKSTLIDCRIACHPVRLWSDAEIHARLPEPLIMPFSALNDDIKDKFIIKQILDFGIELTENMFCFNDNYAQVPSVLVIAYALAVASSGKASKIFLAGFDGYPPPDKRNDEINRILKIYNDSAGSLEVISVTNTIYDDLKCQSIYGL